MKPNIIITDLKNYKEIKKLNKKIKVLIYEKLINIKSDVKKNFFTSRIDTDPYCIINTSGSTGVPKGVVLSHKNFFDFMQWTNNEFNFKKI